LQGKKKKCVDEKKCTPLNKATGGLKKKREIRLPDKSGEQLGVWDIGGGKKSRSILKKKNSVVGEKRTNEPQ